MEKNKKLFYLFLFIIEPMLVLISFVVFLFQKKHFALIFAGNVNPILQITIGFACGIMVSVPCVQYIYKKKVFSDVMDILKDLIDGFELNVFDFIVISLAAAICEEILFRATLQPMLGIWITSFIFILLHGYFNPTNWKIFLFGAIMFVISALIGLVCNWFGIFAAIGFHFSYDFLVLWLISGFINKNSN